MGIFDRIRSGRVASPAGQQSSGGGGGSSSSGIAGAVQFSGGSGAFAADASNIFWDNSTKRLGIGTGTPGTNIYVRSSGASGTDHGLTNENNSANAVGGSFAGKKSRGTSGSPVALSSGDRIVSFNGFGYGTSYGSVPDASIIFSSSEAFTGSAHGTSIDFWTTPLGSTSERMVAKIGPSAGLILFDSAGSKSVTISRPTTGSNYNFTLPGADGTSGQFLQTDGSGNLSFATAGGGILANDTYYQIYNSFGSPVDIFKIDSNVDAFQFAVPVNVNVLRRLDGSGVNAIDLQNFQIRTPDNIVKIDYAGDALNDINAVQSVGWTTRTLFNSSGVGVFNWSALPFGSSGNVLSTDGAGNLSWISAGGGGLPAPLQALASYISDSSPTGAGSFLGNDSDSDQATLSVQFGSTNTAIAGNNTSGVVIMSGANSAASSTGNAGEVGIYGGVIVDGTGSGGLVLLEGGFSSGGTPGDIYLSGGGSTANPGGNITLSPGSGTARGKIQFQNGSEGTSGWIWVSTDAGGAGTWMAPGVAGWQKFTYTFNEFLAFTGLQDGTIDIITLESNRVVSGIYANLRTDFNSGTAAASSDYQIDIGYTTVPAAYLSAIVAGPGSNVAQTNLGYAPGGQYAGTKLGAFSNVINTQITIHLNASLIAGSLDSLTAGEIDIYLKVEDLNF